VLSIKSVNVRSKGVNRRLLMSSGTLAIFESFLKEHIGQELLIVNTNFGMEIYYYSKKDYSKLIQETLLKHTTGKFDVSRLIFRYNLTRQQVYESFCAALLTFAQYPQLFLAYAKKFMYLRDKNITSRYIIPILSGFFEEVLTSLEDKGTMPHYEKIVKAKNKPQKTKLDHTIKELISEILLKKHLN